MQNGRLKGEKREEEAQKVDWARKKKKEDKAQRNQNGCVYRQTIEKQRKQ